MPTSHRIVKEDSSQEVMFEQRPHETVEGGSYLDTWGERRLKPYHPDSLGLFGEKVEASMTRIGKANQGATREMRPSRALQAVEKVLGFIIKVKESLLESFEQRNRGLISVNQSTPAAV